MSLLDALLLDPYRINVWIAYRTDGVTGTGTQNDPWDASAATKFDAIMNSLSANTTVHLGPTTSSNPFQTTGFWANSDGSAGSGWEPKAGMKIVGSGIDVTTLKLTGAADPGMGVTVLKLVGAAYPYSKYYVIGNSYFVTPFEASDFSVDCNLPGQSISGYAYPSISCAGVFIQGAHMRLRRIQAINFGSLRPDLECFVFWLAGADPGRPEAVDCVIEDCIAENPSVSNGAINSILIMASMERNSDGVPSYHRACVIRNCVVDCLYRSNPVSIASISYAGLVATVATRTPHNRATNDWVVVSGALENGLTSQYFNGSFQITVPDSDPFRFQYTMQSPGPSAIPTGDMWVGRFSSHYVNISALDPQNVSGQWFVTLTSSTPHFRVPGDYFNVDDVFVIDPVTGFTVLSPIYNGVFAVDPDSVLSPFQLKYKITADPTAEVLTYGTWVIGVTLQALGIDGGTAAVAEGNRIFNCTTMGPYHDTWSSKDSITRNNYGRAVLIGTYQSMGSLNPGYFHQTGVPITHVGTTATFTTQHNHGLQVGQAVRISFTKVRGDPSNQYNGYFSVDGIPQVNGVPQLNQFTYQMNSDPGADADTSPTPKYSVLWQTRSLIDENNIIELVPPINNFWRSQAITLAHWVGDRDLGAQKLYPRVVIRNNLIRHADGLSDSPLYSPSLAIYLRTCGYALIEENVINLGVSVPIDQASNTAVSYFDNADPGGKLIEGMDYTQPDYPVKQSDLKTAFEDASLLAI